jgi:glyoxylase-like metal-dependent hydrolase (beta-lactamase superfamily II)
MPRPRAFRELRLLNDSTGDPCLFVDDQGRDNALLIDCGDNAVLGDDRIADLEAVLLTHHRVDHFIGFDRVVRATKLSAGHEKWMIWSNGVFLGRLRQRKPQLKLPRAPI